MRQKRSEHGMQRFLALPSGRLFRLFSSALATLLLLNSLFLAYMLFSGAGTLAQVQTGVHVEAVIGQLLAAVFCFRGLPVFWRRPQNHLADISSSEARAWLWVPFLIGLVFIINSCADITYILYYMSQVKPSFDWPNAIYLLRYPCLLLAILALPRRPLLLSGTRLRVMLDGCLIISALVTFSWYFLLGPMFQQSTTFFARMVGIAFPLGDILLCNCLLQLSIRSGESRMGLAQRLLGSGLACIIVTDSLGGYDIVQGTQQLQPWIMLSQCIGYLLIMLTTQALYAERTSPQHESDVTIADRGKTIPASIWLAALQYSVVPALGILLLTIWHLGRSGVLIDGVFIGSLIVIGLIFVRQVLVAHATFLRTRDLQHMQDDLRIKNAELEEANLRLEQQAVQLEAAYEQQRGLNELKDQFLLNVNHELRTPLTEVHGYLELLYEHFDALEPSTRMNFLSHALHGSEDLHLLINTVLDTLHTENGEKELHWEELPVQEVVQMVVDLFEPQKRELYQVELDIPETLHVWADRQYMHQILRNLLSNAFKYAPHHTLVMIGAQPEADTRQLCIWVRDAGPGIAPQEISQLFGKFVRLKRDQASSVRGTGLGLYICKQLVEAMEGRIWVESSGVPGEGSCFYFTLPTLYEAPLLSSTSEKQPPHATMQI